MGCPTEVGHRREPEPTPKGSGFSQSPAGRARPAAPPIGLVGSARAVDGRHSTGRRRPGVVPPTAPPSPGLLVLRAASPASGARPTSSCSSPRWSGWPFSSPLYPPSRFERSLVRFLASFPHWLGPAVGHLLRHLRAARDRPRGRRRRLPTPCRLAPGGCLGRGGRCRDARLSASRARSLARRRGRAPPAGRRLDVPRPAGRGIGRDRPRRLPAPRRGRSRRRYGGCSSSASPGPCWPRPPRRARPSPPSSSRSSRPPPCGSPRHVRRASGGRGRRRGASRARSPVEHLEATARQPAGVFVARGRGADGPAAAGQGLRPRRVRHAAAREGLADRPVRRAAARELRLSRLEAAEHEAFVTLLAAPGRRADARGRDRSASPRTGDALLVFRDESRPLAELSHRGDRRRPARAELAGARSSRRRRASPTTASIPRPSPSIDGEVGARSSSIARRVAPRARPAPHRPGPAARHDRGPRRRRARDRAPRRGDRRRRHRRAAAVPPDGRVRPDAAHAR